MSGLKAPLYFPIPQEEHTFPIDNDFSYRSLKVSADAIQAIPASATINKD